MSTKINLTYNDKEYILEYNKAAAHSSSIVGL